LARASRPEGRTYDGIDLAPLLFQGIEPDDRPFFYYRGDTLAACRLGNYKAHFTTQDGYSPQKPEKHEPPVLFDLAVDPGEQLNIAAEHPEVLAKIAAAVAAHQSSIEPVINQLQ